MTDEEKRSEAEAEASKAAGATEPSGTTELSGATEPSGATVAGEEPGGVAATDPDDEGDHDGHDGGHGHGGHEDHQEHLGHTAPMSLLIGVLLALGLLTVLTVVVTAVDLGSQGNFVVAMVIATIKAILVMGYFMHMFWDSKFNVVAFTSSFLFVLLFLAMTVLDRSEYQLDVNNYENDKKVQM